MTSNIYTRTCEMEWNNGDGGRQVKYEVNKNKVFVEVLLWLKKANRYPEQNI